MHEDDCQVGGFGDVDCLLEVAPGPNQEVSLALLTLFMGNENHVLAE